jgi:hypothetical protein
MKASYIVPNSIECEWHANLSVLVAGSMSLALNVRVAPDLRDADFIITRRLPTRYPHHS